MYLEKELYPTRMCASCSGPCDSDKNICSTCTNTVTEFSSEMSNPLITESQMPGEVDQEYDIEEGSFEDAVKQSPDKKKRVSYKDDFELVTLRHSELGRAIASCKERGIDLNVKLSGYKKTIQRTTNWFWAQMKYQPVLSRNGYLQADLLSFGLAWGTIYIGLYEKGSVISDQDPGSENQKLITEHIKQKCIEFIGTLYKKQKCVLPEKDVGASFSLSNFSVILGRPIDLPARPVGAGTTNTADVVVGGGDDAYRRRHNRLSMSNDEARRRDAKRILEEMLAGRNHNEIVELMETTSQNESLCPDTRMMASKLKNRTLSCIKKTESGVSDHKCVICKIRNRQAATMSLGYPQANNLQHVRQYTLSLIKGEKPFRVLEGEPEAISRHTAFYRHASRVLGFAIENKDGSTSPTKWAYALKDCEPLSDEEAELFLSRILEAKSLKEAKWFFSTLDDVPKDVLAADIMHGTSLRQGFDHVSPKTALRRAGTLLEWRWYVLSHLIEELLEENKESGTGDFTSTSEQVVDLPATEST